MRAALIFAFLACACAASSSQDNGLAAGNNPLPFSLPNMEGRNVSTASYVGKVVLVDIWATWCKPCLKSFPFYAQLYKEHKAQGFELLAVSVDKDDDQVRRFLEANQVPFPVLRDPNGSLPNKLSIETMPTAFLIDRSGGVVKVHEGFVSTDQSKITAMVQEALKATAPGSAPRGAP